ncbi:hypothetical protein [Phenylobacterium sp.]|uniref:hypothetical protein n=1 Tax=Phenylobacterium sp. TaxID=1871053 RepID=UPI00391A48CE
MSSALEGQLVYNIANTPVRPYPYPHLYVPQVFPAEYYAALQANIPDPDVMLPIEQARPVRGYKERFVLDLNQHGDRLTADQNAFWRGTHALLTRGGLRDCLLRKFNGELRKRFEAGPVTLSQETLLVEDITRYALGPHTDTPAKVITVLFYLPRDESQAHLGTSIYVPKDPTRRCPGGPHHGYEDFDRVATMPFMPNSMFAFVKTDNSFHGVEPVTDPDVRRWLLLYDIKVQRTPAQPPTGQPAAAR